MSLFHLAAPVALSVMTVLGALTGAPRFFGRESVNPFVIMDSTDSAKTADSVNAAQPDTFTPPMVGSSLRYGVDTTVSPCVDFYMYVNGDWRAKTKLGKVDSARIKRVEIFGDAYRRTKLRLRDILDSAHSLASTTTDPTLKVLGTFYGSCLTADSLEPNLLQRAQSKKTPIPDSSRADQCVQRTIATLAGALGQAFASDLLASHAMERMEALLEALRTATINQVSANPWMNADEKRWAQERLQKLHLRVGMPKEMMDYSPLVLTSDYKQNKIVVANFNNRQWVNAIGGDVRARWKASLLTPNAFYMGGDHAIEIPAVMFMPPFFDVHAEDALNFAGIGFVIGHEIFHSIATQLPAIAHPEMKTNIEQFKLLNSDLGTVDGWNTDGKRTFVEDIADYGGVLVSYAAWKATLKQSGKPAAPKVDGYTPDQRFFIGLARVWRSKWQGGMNWDVHSAPFARVNAMVLNSPQFAKAFGCKAGDPMVRPADKKVLIW